MHATYATSDKDIDAGGVGGQHGCRDCGRPGYFIGQDVGQVSSAHFPHLFLRGGQALYLAIGQSDMDFTIEDRDGCRDSLLALYNFLDGLCALFVGGVGHAMRDDGRLQCHNRPALV